LIIDTTKGHLIKMDSKYYFQQNEIDDIKISLKDRERSYRSYVSKYRLKEFEEETNISLLNDKLLYEVNELRKMLSIGMENDEADEFIYDMIVDRIDFENVQDIPSIKDENLLQSLQRGDYILIENSKIKSYYNVFVNGFYCNKNSTYKKCDIVTNNKMYEKLRKKFTESIHDDEIIGFIDIIGKAETKTYELKSKIKYMDGKNKKSYGSACINTSSITLKMLRDQINMYDKDLKIQKFSKKNLCLLYEYLLRKRGLFLRTIEYKIIKN
jgi:hypothetical protein